MLELQTVCKSFTGVAAVQDLSFFIKQGKTYGVLGPNGAGKTTTLRMIAGILIPDHGRITLDGELVSQKLQHKIGYLPEERGLYPKMTVYDQLMYFARLKGMVKPEAHQNILAWLKRFDLSNHINRNVESLSKGNQQKLQIIAAIAHNPELIILDEPFSGLDLMNIDLLVDVIGDLKSKGKTVLISSHLIDQVEPLCDALTFIHKGRALLSGYVEDIISRFSESWWDMRINENGDALEAFAGIQEIDRHEKSLNRLKFTLKPGVAIQHVLAKLPSTIQITGLEQKPLSLKQILLSCLHNDGVGSEEAVL